MASTIKSIHADRTSRLNKRNRDVSNDLESKHRCHGLGRRSMNVKAALMEELNLSNQEEADVAPFSDFQHEAEIKH